MACGTGKTLAAMWIAEGLGSSRSLVLVPSLSLLAQTLREWAANASQPFEYLAVCSDETVVGVDQFVPVTAELGFPVTTNPSVIAAFLRRRGRRVVFATYQSSPQIAAAHRQRSPHFDLAIADEAHRCAGRTSSEFATVLDAGEIRCERRLFMTATPRFYTLRLRSEAGLLDVDVASMDDQRVFGPVLHRLTFGEAIERDLLSDYQVVVVGVDNETYRAWAEHGEYVTRDGSTVTDARTLAGQIGLAKSMRKYRLRRIVCFLGRVKAAREFSAEMPNVIRWTPPRVRPSGELWSEHVSGAMTSGHRDRLLLRFRDLASDERGLLSNARCLGEGVDVPSIDCVAFIDPRRSTIDIVQALGRAIRKSPDKRLGTIVLPVFLASDEDPDHVLNDSAFEHVWDVLKALRAHDETLGEELDELRRRIGARRAAPRRPGKIKLDVPAGQVGTQFVHAFNARLVERTTASWEFWFGLLTRYADEHGKAATTVSTVVDGYRLGAWAINQRSRYARGDLPKQRAERLQALPGWEWNPLDAEWERMYALLERYVDREGDAWVTREHLEDGEQLGAWVRRQRDIYLGKRLGHLRDEQITRLQSLPRWAWERGPTKWEQRFQALVAFADREGHTKVPYGHVESGLRLEKWVVRQRVDYAAGRLQRLPGDRVARLEALPGWHWADPVADRWERAYAALVKFQEREGHLRIPNGHVEDGITLWRWAGYQKARYAAGKMQRYPDRITRLEAVPGWRWREKRAEHPSVPV